MATAASRYDALTDARRPFLDRARHNALLTIPSLIRLEGDTGDSHLYEPYNGLGAKALLNLASRISTALMRFPFVKLEVPDDVTLQNQGVDDPEFERQLALTERMVQRRAEARGWHGTTYTSLQQLEVAGNVMEQMFPTGNIRVIRIDQYVVKRDFQGNLLEFVIEDKMSPASLPEAARPLLDGVSGGENTSDKKELKLYTHCVRVWNAAKKEYEYKVRQELNGHTVPGTEGVYRIDELPYAALRWAETPGEDYGRSKIEEHIGDFRSLEGLEKSMLEHAAMAARNMIMLKPGATGGGLRNRVAKANNGDVLVGDFDQMKMLGFENLSGFQVTAKQVEEIRRSIAQAFLLSSAGQRDAERVTAREIDRDINEIEGAVGGTFANLSSEMMGWRINRLILQMQQENGLPAWDKGQIEPKVLTGLEALSREREGQRSLQALQVISADPDATHIVKKNALYGKILLGLGLPDMVNTPDETQQSREARAQLEAMQSAAGPAVQAAGRIAETAAKTEEG